MSHQLSLFGFQRPRAKVPISKERIEEAKAMIAKKDSRGAVVALREIRYKLEAFEKRIHHDKSNNP